MPPTIYIIAGLGVTVIILFLIIRIKTARNKAIKMRAEVAESQVQHDSKVFHAIKKVDKVEMERIRNRINRVKKKVKDETSESQFDDFYQ